MFKFRQQEDDKQGPSKHPSTSAKIGCNYHPKAAQIDIKALSWIAEESVTIPHHKLYKSMRLIPHQTFGEGVKLPPLEGISIEKGLAVVGHRAAKSPPISPTVQRQLFQLCNSRRSATSRAMQVYIAAVNAVPNEAVPEFPFWGPFLRRLELRVPLMQLVVYQHFIEPVLNEIQAAYVYASKQAITNYALLDPVMHQRWGLKTNPFHYSLFLIKAPVPWGPATRCARRLLRRTLMTGHWTVVRADRLHPIDDCLVQMLSDTLVTTCKPCLADNLVAAVQGFVAQADQHIEKWQDVMLSQLENLPERIRGALVWRKVESLADSLLESFLTFLQQRMKWQQPIMVCEVLPDCEPSALQQVSRDQVTLCAQALASIGAKLTPKIVNVDNTRHEYFHRLNSLLGNITFPESVELLSTKHQLILLGSLGKDVDFFTSSDYTPEDYEVKTREFDCLDLEVCQSKIYHDGSLVRWRVEPLWRAIRDEIWAARNRLCAYTLERNRAQNESIIDVYEPTIKRLLVMPKSTEQFIDLISLILETENTTIPYITQQAQMSVARYNALINSTPLEWVSARDLLSFKMIFRMPKRLHKAVKTMRYRIEEHRRELEADLDARCLKTNDKLVKFRLDLDTVKKRELFVPTELEKMVAKLNGMKAAVADIMKNAALIAKQQALLALPLTEFPDLPMLHSTFTNYYDLWTLALESYSKQTNWMTGTLKGLDVDEMQESLERWDKKLAELSEAFDGVPGAMNVLSTLIMRQTRMKNYAPVITAVCNPGMRDRHWESLSKVLGPTTQLNDSSSLNDLLSHGITKHVDMVETVSETAAKEYTLEMTVMKMKEDWACTSFEMALYRDSGVYLLNLTDEVKVMLENHIVKTQTMTTSPFVGGLLPEVKQWLSKLLYLRDTLLHWTRCQSTWVYLEPLFSSEDIAQQIPEETAKFYQVDEIWRRLCAQAIRDCSVFKVIDIPDLLKDLRICLDIFETIQRGFNQYMERKRLYFPRFFFLSNDELLEILSETRNPERVQPHLPKLFEGIYRLRFNERNHIVGMLSAQGEYVTFCRSIMPALAKGQVEKWLLEVEDVMVRTIKQLIGDAIATYDEATKLSWIFKYPSQIVQCVSRVFWTQAVEEALPNSGRLERLLEQHKNFTGQLINLVQSELQDVQRITAEALIVFQVYGRDVIEELLRYKVSSKADFTWTSHLRYYWQDGDLYIHMMNTVVRYDCEYLGATPRLVITPLTLRCQRTLMSALQFCLGGAPEGPAATGKTETVKDLARAVGKQCVVFNCSEGLDSRAMSKFFKGIATTGAWACFDEINRVNPDVLSVVATQVLTIQQALQQRKARFVFESTELTLNQSCAVFVTLNPVYTGRSELPDNFKTLFRPVAMSLPDYSKIVETSLYFSGFRHAHTLAIKVINAFRSSSELLSHQHHYDFGMRAMKAALLVSKHLRRVSSEADETAVILEAISDANLPKFLTHDAVMFTQLMRDLFPGHSVGTRDQALLKSAICSVFEQRGLPNVPYMMDKVLQILKDALDHVHTQATNLGLSIHYDSLLWQVINPKAISLKQLYGGFDPVSHDWIDGVLGQAFREQAADPNPEGRGYEKWIVLDGPVDSVWAETLNSVLDDNKKLCLPSGEIIRMSPAMRIVFEVTTLAQASPATVSRCAIVHFDANQLTWEALYEQRMQRAFAVLPSWRTHATTLLKSILPKIFSYLAHSTLVPQRSTFMVNNFFFYLESILGQFPPTRGEEPSATMVQSLTWFACYWGCAALLRADKKKQLANMFDNLSISEGWDLEASLRQSCLECCPVFSKRELTWDHWSKLFDNKESFPFLEENFEFLHVDQTISLTCWLHWHVQTGVPLLIVGSAASGKSATIINYLVNLDSLRYTVLRFTFVASTSAAWFQQALLGQLERKTKGCYGAPEPTRAVVFIDDFGAVQPDVYGVVEVYELLRQLLDYGYWFDQDCTHVSIEHVTFVCASQPTDALLRCGDSSNQLLSHFSLYYVDDYNDKERQTVLLHVAEKTIDNKPPDQFKELVAMSIECYNHIISHFHPIPEHLHYQCTFRDLVTFVQAFAKSITPEMAKRDLFELWGHEMLRGFHDKMMTSADRLKLFEIVKSVSQHRHPEFLVMQHYKQTLSNVFTTLLEGKQNIYLKADYSSVEPVLRKYIKDFLLESGNSAQNVVLFEVAAQHILRTVRVLELKNGHLLHLGASGTGRKLLARLASYIAGAEWNCLDTTGSYTSNDWRDHLRKMLRKAGLDNQRVVLMVPDSQIRDSIIYLEDLCQIISNGSIETLFTLEQQTDIIERIQYILPKSETKVHYPQQYCFQAFAEQVRVNFHVIFCMNAVEPRVQRWLVELPSLVNCCTINWFEPWTGSALSAVGSSVLSGMQPFSADDISKCISLCQVIHETAVSYSERTPVLAGCRGQFFTSAYYLEMVTLFRKLAQQKYEQLSTFRDRYKTGVARLDFAGAQISVMQLELTKLQPELVTTSAETERLMMQIEHETVEVEHAKEVVASDEAAANEAAARAQMIKDECEHDLAEAIPALEAAIDALNTLKGTDISMLKTLKSPPLPIKMVLEAVCIMLDEKPIKTVDPERAGSYIEDYWPVSKRLLADMHFIDRLKRYDKDNIPDHTVAKIRNGKYIGNPDFEPERIKQVSLAAEGICLWVRAVEVYDRVLRVVRPKKQRLKDAEMEMKRQMETLRVKRQELLQVTEKLQALNDEFGAATQRKKDLEGQIDLCEKKLDRAGRLIHGLGGEKSRWQERSEELSAECNNVLGDVLLGAGTIVYLGAFGLEVRKKFITCWKQQCAQAGINTSAKFDLAITLGDPVKIKAWTSSGLPKDSLSIDNGVIVDVCAKWPLIIDPQGEAKRWIKSVEQEKLVTAKMGTGNLQRALENAITMGVSLMIESIKGTLDPLLQPVLLKQTYRSGGVKTIKLGNDGIHYADTFKLYLLTSDARAQLSPDLLSKVTVVNFVLTPKGVEELLLSLLVTLEAPELQKRKDFLQMESAANSRQLKELEDKILELLSSTKGNILENERAVQMLSSAKDLSDEVLEKQHQTAETERDIDHLREQYRSLAHYARVLFFALLDLAKLDPMYQFSIGWFTKLYRETVDRTKRAHAAALQTASARKKESVFNGAVAATLYEYVCTSIFEQHKLVFAFLLCTSLLRDRKLVSQASLADLADLRPERLSSSASEEKTRSIDDNVITQLIRCKKDEPRKFLEVVTSIIVKELGPAFTQPPSFSFARSYAESTCRVPLIVILSRGADPINQLLKFSEELGYTQDRVLLVSLGKGQGEIAEKMIEAGMQNGSWVVLQNCHFGVDWLPTLEFLCENLLTRDVHEDFRLWLTTYPTRHFPNAILQAGVKITTEPPSGLRSSLLQIYQSNPVCDLTFFGDCKNPGLWQRMLFALCYFHAALQERQDYGKHGWSDVYHFSDSDLKISMSELQALLKDCADKQHMPRKALVFLIGECNYGGKVSNTLDRQLLRCMLDEYFRLDLVVKLANGHSLRNHDDFLTVIRQLPLYASPEACGLSANLDSVKNTEMTNQFLSALNAVYTDTLTQPKLKSKQSTALIEKIMTRLPKLIEVQGHLLSSPDQDAVDSVFSADVAEYNYTVTNLLRRLEQLRTIMLGKAVPTKLTAVEMESLVSGHFPRYWLPSSRMPTITTFYEQRYKERSNFLNMYMQHGMPQTVDLGLLGNIKAFLIALRQNYARKAKLQLDMVDLRCNVANSEERDNSEATLLITGLFLEGARFDTETGRLVELNSTPKELFTTLPTICLKPYEIKAAHSNPKIYACPVFYSRTSSGDGSVLTIELPSDKPPDHWTLRGVAAVCVIE